MSDTDLKSEGIAERLQREADEFRDRGWRTAPQVCEEAKALIERQQKEIEALKAALRPFAEESECWEPVEGEDKIGFGHEGAFTDFTMADVREAARVLSGGSK